MFRGIIKILFLTIVLLTGCDILQSDDPVSARNYFPLSIGSKWYYSNSPENKEKITQTWEVTGSKTVNGYLFYEVTKSTGNNSWTEYYRYEGSRIIVFSGRLDPDSVYYGRTVSHFGVYADFSKSERDTFRCDIDDLKYRITVKEKSEDIYVFYFDDVIGYDEEHEITFKKGVGITRFYSVGWGTGSYLIRYEWN